MGVGGVANSQQRSPQGRSRVGDVDICQRYVFPIQGSYFARFPIVPWSYIIIVHSFVFRFSFYSFPNLLWTLLCAAYGLLPLRTDAAYALSIPDGNLWRSFSAFVWTPYLLPSFSLNSLKRNGIALTQSLYFLGDSIHVPNVCGRATITTPILSSASTHVKSYVPYTNSTPRSQYLSSSSTVPTLTGCIVWFYSDTGDAMQRYSDSEGHVQNRLVKAS